MIKPQQQNHSYQVELTYLKGHSCGRIRSPTTHSLHLMAFCQCSFIKLEQTKIHLFKYVLIQTQRKNRTTDLRLFKDARLVCNFLQLLVRNHAAVCHPENITLLATQNSKHSQKGHTSNIISSLKLFFPSYSVLSLLQRSRPLFPAIRCTFSLSSVRSLIFCNVYWNITNKSLVAVVNVQYKVQQQQNQQRINFFKVTWHGAWLYDEHRMYQDGSSFTWHQHVTTQQCCKYTTSMNIFKCTIKATFTHLEAHTTKVRWVCWRVAPYKSGHNQRQAAHKYAIYKSLKKFTTIKSQAHYFLMASSNPSMTPGIFSPMYCCCSVTSNICSRSSWMPWATHNSHTQDHTQCSATHMFSHMSSTTNFFLFFFPFMNSEEREQKSSRLSIQISVSVI